MISIYLIVFHPSIAPSHDLVGELKSPFEDMHTEMISLRGTLDSFFKRNIQLTNKCIQTKKTLDAAMIHVQSVKKQYGGNTGIASGIEVVRMNEYITRSDDRVMSCHVDVMSCHIRSCCVVLCHVVTCLCFYSIHMPIYVETS